MAHDAPGKHIAGSEIFQKNLRVWWNHLDALEKLQSTPEQPSGEDIQTAPSGLLTEAQAECVRKGVKDSWVIAKEESASGGEGSLAGRSTEDLTDLVEAFEGFDDTRREQDREGVRAG